MTELNEIYTTMPGVVVSYDGKMAVVRPALSKQLTNGDQLAPPQIVNVPLKWFVGDNGQAVISVPLKPGDPVVLHFACRSIENWLSGADGPPDDPRQFDLTDCFATPVMRPGVAVTDPDNVTVQYGGGSLKISPDGTITFKGLVARFELPMEYTQGFTGSGGAGGSTMVIRGNVDFRDGTLTHNGIPVGSTHTHPNGNGGTTGTPNP